MSKDEGAFRTIGEVSDALNLPQHVLRFWETRFSQIDPLKRSGNRRYYRPDDVALIKAIRRLLYQEGYTIKGVQRLLKSSGARAVAASTDVPGAAQTQSGSMHTDLTEHGHGDPAGSHSGSSVVPDAERSAADEPPILRAEDLAALAAELESCARRLADARQAAT